MSRASYMLMTSSCKYTTVRSDADSINLQGCLDMVSDWSNEWQLCISKQKCFIFDVKKDIVHFDNSFIYKLGADDLNCTDTVLDLGVTIDSHLDFDDHIAAITRKAHQRANLILRCFLSHETVSLVKAFTVYVRP